MSNKETHPEDICPQCANYTWNQDHQDILDSEEERVCHLGHIPKEDDQGPWCPYWERFNLAQG